MASDQGALDCIGGFPFADPNCKGCGQPLLLENAWMTDGCPCNTELGVNSMNEIRWRLLMKLQQKQARDRSDSEKQEAEHRERLAWNLAACLTLAESRRQSDFSRELALPALIAVDRLVRDFVFMEFSKDERSWTSSIPVADTEGSYWWFRPDLEQYPGSYPDEQVLYVRWLRGAVRAICGGRAVKVTEMKGEWSGPLRPPKTQATDVRSLLS